MVVHLLSCKRLCAVDCKSRTEKMMQMVHQQRYPGKEKCEEIVHI